MWLFVSILNMIAVAATRLLQKSFVSRSSMNAFRLNLFMFGFGLPIVLLVIATHMDTILHLQLAFWLTLVAVVLGYYPATSYLYVKAIRANELSSVLPLQSSIPVFTVMLGWLLLGQAPSALALGGILAVTVSIYILCRNPGTAWYKPLVSLKSSGAAGAMLIVSFITAAAAIGDKFAIEHSGIVIYLALNLAGAVVVLTICDRIAVKKSLVQPLLLEIANLTRTQRIALIGLGCLQFFSIILSFVAVGISANTGYTIAIRNINIVMASLAAVVLLNEHLTRRKLLSYILSVIGVVMIAL